MQANTDSDVASRIPDCYTALGELLFEGLQYEIPTSHIYREENIFARHQGLSSYLEDNSGHVISQRYMPTSISDEERRSFRDSRRRIISFSGTSCLLVTPGAARNYYHWTLDLLPKIIVAKSHGIDFNNVDRIIVNCYAFQFQKDSIELVAPELQGKIVESRGCRYSFHEHVIVPVIHNRAPLPFKHTAALDYIPKTIIGDANSSEKRRIYVSRNHASRRKVVNEDEIRLVFDKYGFEVVNMEDHNIREQAYLFSSATIVVAVHGAALTNLVYCKIGTQILELFSFHKRPFYWTLAYQQNLCYSALLCEYGSPPQSNLESQEANLYVDPYQLEYALEKMLT